MIMKYFKDADVILKNSDTVAYYFIDEGYSVFLRTEDISNSYVVAATLDDLWQDIEDMLQNDYFNIIKGKDLINTFASGA